MQKNIFSAFLVFIFFTFLFGVIYPAFLTFTSHQLFPQQAQGSLIKKDGKILGSELIGQDFSDPKYLWGRLSATSPNPYNASASAGGNFDLGNPKFKENAQNRIRFLKESDPDNNAQIPIDLVTTSASGLDPQISVDSAFYQAQRIANIRNISVEEVIQIIKKHTQNKQIGLLGEARVNVLLVNLELDKKI